MTTFDLSNHLDFFLSMKEYNLYYEYNKRFGKSVTDMVLGQLYCFRKVSNLNRLQAAAAVVK